MPTFDFQDMANGINDATYANWTWRPGEELDAGSSNNLNVDAPPPDKNDPNAAPPQANSVDERFPGGTATSALPTGLPELDLPEIGGPQDGRNDDCLVKTAQQGQSIASMATEYLGLPYRFGGNPPSCADCSSLVKDIFRRHQLSLGRTAAQQSRVGHRFSDTGQLQPGDRLYFWNDDRSKISHTAVYVGNGQVIHASWHAQRVKYEYVSNLDRFAWIMR